MAKSIHKTDAAGTDVQFTYDALGRLIRETRLGVVRAETRCYPIAADDASDWDAEAPPSPADDE